MVTPTQQRANDYSNDARKWLAVFRRLVTQQRAGKRVSKLAVKNAANEAYFATVKAAHYAQLS